jgi:hypothetical protein
MLTEREAFVLRCEIEQRVQDILFNRTLKQVYNEIKENAGVPPEVSIDEIIEIDVLDRILHSAEELAIKEGVEC